MKRSLVIVAALACLLSLAQAQVQQRRRYQSQQQQQQQSGYNYKPARLEQIAQPAINYGAPQPQQLYSAPAPAAAPVPAPAPVPASAPARLQAKPARLVANSETQEDIDDAAEEVEVPQAAPVAPRAAPAPVLPVAPLQPPSIVYYPAGAVGFVQPTTFAKFIAAPQSASAAAAYVAAPHQYYAAYLG